MKHLKTVFFCSVVLIAGCGRKKTPPPPLTQSEIVLDTLTALENREHGVALKKISRLRTFDPGNIFLANLEVLERNNSVIYDAQKKMDDNNVKGALEVVNDGIMRYGRHNDLVETRKKLRVVTKIRELIEVFQHPGDSTRLFAAAEQMKKLGEVYSPAAFFIPLAEKQLARAKQMAQHEHKRAIDDLISNINDMQVNKDSDVNVLYAVLDVEDSDNPVLKRYLDYLKGGDSSELIIFQEENIFEEKKEEKTPDTENSGSMFDSSTDADTDNGGDEEKSAEPGTGEQKKEKEKSGWWDKFSF